MSPRRVVYGTEPFRFDAVAHTDVPGEHGVNGDQTLCGLQVGEGGLLALQRTWQLEGGDSCAECRRGYQQDVLGAPWAERKAEPNSRRFDTNQLTVLAPGRRVVKRRQVGDVYGLRLREGGAVPALVVAADWPSGFMSGATAIWIFGPPQHGTTLNLEALNESDPIVEPLLVDQTLWSFGVAFKLGELAADHPLLQHRFLFQNPSGLRPVYDVTDQQVTTVRRSDVIGRYSHTLILGVDQAVARGLAELRGCDAASTSGP